MPLPSWLMPFGESAHSKTKGPSGYSERKCIVCGTRLAFGFKGSSTHIEYNTLICENLKCSLLGQAQFKGQKPPEAPKPIAIAPLASPKSENILTPKSETKWFKSLSPWRKSEIITEESENMAKSQGRPKPRKSFCTTCNTDRTTLGTKCPVCHNTI